MICSNFEIWQKILNNLREVMCYICHTYALNVVASIDKLMRGEIRLV